MYVDKDATQCCGETALCMQLKMLHSVVVRLLYVCR